MTLLPPLRRHRRNFPCKGLPPKEHILTPFCAMLSSKVSNLSLKRQGWNTSPHPWHRKGSRCRLEPSPSARCRVLCSTSSSRNSQPSQRCSAEICQGSTDQKVRSSLIPSLISNYEPANLEGETLQLVLLGVQRTALLGLFWHHSV